MIQLITFSKKAFLFISAMLLAWSVLAIQDARSEVYGFDPELFMEDTIPPEITCPPGIDVECYTEIPPPYANLDEFLQAGGVVSDETGIDSSSFNLASEIQVGICPRIITRTYQVSDLSGNTATCENLIIIEDTTPPTITCPADTVVECVSAALAPNISLVTASDNCGIPNVSFISDVISGYNPTVITRTYMATDSCGYTAACVQLITSNDTIPPQITCPPDLSAVCGIAEVPPYTTLTEFITADGTVVDNCSLDSSSFVLVTQSSDNLTCPETVTRTYQVSDYSGLTATCEQIITINDTIPPIITCPSDVFALCDINEVQPFGSLNEFIAAGGNSFDNCNIDTISFTWIGDFSSGTSCPDIITRTYQVSDHCGNIANCEQLIIVNDTIPPTITSPPELNVECYAEIPPPFVSLDEFVTAGGAADDNCGIDTLEFLYQTREGIQCPVIFNRYYQVTDLCGNTTTCEHRIIVEDTEPPMIICPPDLHFDSMEQVPAPFANLSDYLAEGGQVSDNCGYLEGSFSFEEIVQGEDPVVIERTYSISDSCSNMAFCTMMITVGGQFGIFENDRIDLELKIIPNPSDGWADILFELRETAVVKVFVSDLLGNNARYINPGLVNQGEQKIRLDLRDLPRGIYFVKVSAGRQFATARLILTDL